LSGIVLYFDDLPLTHMKLETRHGGVRRSDTESSGEATRSRRRSDTEASGEATRGRLAMTIRPFLEQ
jgi:hypothetical protein